MDDRRKTKDQLIAELQAVRQSERKFRSYFDRSLVGVGTTSADRRWLDVNDTLCRLLGYTRDELLNLTWTELTHPDDLDRSADGLSQLLSGENPSLVFEKRYVRKDGQIITALVQIHAVYDSVGRFEYAVVNLQDISDRKQTDRALRASEARANLIYQSSSDAMFLMAVESGPVYRCLSVNAAYLTSTGLAATQLIDRTVEEILPASAAQYALDRYAEAIRVRHPIRYEETVELDQVALIVETTLSPIFDADGQCTHLLGSARDVTARKRLDDSLRESERRHRLLADNADDVIWTMDLTGRFTYVSPSVQRLRGYTVEEVLQQSIDQALTPESAAIAIARLTQTIQQIQAGQTIPPSRYELEQPCQDGSTVWTEVTTGGIFDEAGQFVGILGVTRDISERRRAEAQLRESEALYRSILTASPDNITITDLDGWVHMVSPAAVKMLGAASADDLIGQTADDFIVPADRARANAHLAGMFQGQPFGPSEYRLQRLDGQTLEVEVNAELIRGANGQPQGVVLISRDITARKQAEAALRASEERYRQLADDAPLAVVVTDVGTGQVVYANQRAFDLFEISREEGIGSSAPVWYADPRDRQRLLELLHTQGAASNFEARMVTGRGREIWVTVNASRSVFEGRLALQAVYSDSTARKQTQAALQASEERYRQLADDAPLAVAVIDVASAKIVYANRQALTSFELTLEQALSSTALDRYVDPADRAPLLDRLRRDGRVSDYIVPMKTGSGRVRWMSLTSNLTTFEGRPAIHTLYIDVTERLRAAAAEREQRELAEALRDTAAALNSTLKLDEVLDQILLSVERVIRYDAADILLLDGDHTTAWSARHRTHRGVDDVAQVLARRLPLAQARNLREMLLTGEPVVIDETHTDPGWIYDPATAWIQSNLGLPIRIQGETLGFLSIDSASPRAYSAADAERLRTFADQAAAAIRNAQLHEQVQQHAADLERRVAERTAELERERTRLQAILDAVDEAIYFMNTDGHIRYANAATSRITGYNFEEIVGRRPQELWRSTATPEAVLAHLERIFVDGTASYGIEVVNRHKTGSLYHAQLSVATLRDANGQIMGYAVVQRDITRIKELEHLKSQFTSRIGHELRTPLTSLMIYLDLLEHGKLEKRDKYLRTLNVEADRLRRLIEGFMRMSEIDSASQLPELTAVNLNEIVSGMLLKQRALAASRRIEIEPQLDSALPRVLAEAGPLAEAIERLLDNAVNYTPDEGHIAVTTAVQIDGAHRWAVLSIMDSGPGFSPTDQLHLFERFYRGDAARDYKTPGAGLSLAICYGIVKRLGGLLIVDNQAEQGAIVSVWLPPAV